MNPTSVASSMSNSESSFGKFGLTVRYENYLSRQINGDHLAWPILDAQDLVALFHLDSPFLGVRPAL